MADLLRSRYNEIEVELIRGDRGAFEIRRDGRLIFSKQRLGRFPEEGEIIKQLDD